MKIKSYMLVLLLFISGCGDTNKENIQSQPNPGSKIEKKPTVSPELKEKGSPLNPFSETKKEDTDPQSPKNAKPIKEDVNNLPAGHPAKAQKIEKDDPDLQKKGSPANPIEDFTGKDITN